ncbi:MAG: outer membrane receptor for ferrienterochelin and colicins [Rhodothermales bacterium]|jgi:outer membrane receptor for ferrienterochelin and colicins
MRRLLFLVFLAGFSAAGVQAQSASVMGRVVDEAGAPLPGVNVVVAGTIRGSATDVDGDYQILGLSPGAVRLSASAIGFQTLVRDLTLFPGAVTVDFILVEDVLQTGEVVITASRRPQALLETPASVSVLSTADLEVRNIVALDDALRYVPGVHVQENQVNVRGSSGFAYNTGSRVLLLLDGMPLLTPDSDGMPFDALPIAQIERIEVLKGPGSALYGGGALGGVINVITRDAGPDPRTTASGFVGAHAPVRYQVWRAGYPKGGEFRTFGGFSISHSRRLSDDWGGWVNLSVRRDEGYLNFSRASFLQAFTKLNWTPKSGKRGELLLGFLAREKVNFLFWNGARDALNPGSLAIGSQDSTGDPTGTNDILATQLTVLPSFSSFVGDHIFYSLRGRVFGSVLRPLDAEGNVKALDNGTLGIRYGGEAQVDWVPNESRTVTFGASGDALVTQSSFFVTADGDSTGGQPETALFAQWEERLGSVSASSGLRLDRYAIDTGTTLQRLSPKVAASLIVGPRTSLRVSYGHGFRAPSLAERFTDNQDFFPIVRNLSLKPERNISFEAGLRDTRLVAAGWQLETDLAVFVSEYYDLIEARLVPELRAFQFINLTRARIAGSEVSLEASRGGHSLRLGYTLLDAQDKTIDQPLASRSKHQLTTGFEAEVLRWATLGADLRLMSAPESVDSDFALFVQDADLLVSMRVLDLRATFRRGPLTATLLLNNALDYYYLERPAFLAPPRHLQIRVQATF